MPSPTIQPIFAAQLVGGPFRLFLYRLTLFWHCAPLEHSSLDFGSTLTLPIRECTQGGIGHSSAIDAGTALSLC